MARQPRAEAVQGERRRRRAETLDGMENMNLALPEECRADNSHTYRWVNDEGYRVKKLYNQDWDTVETSKTAAAPEDETRRQVGVKKDGSPLFAVLMKKPVEYHKADQREKIRATEVREDNLVATPDLDPSSADAKATTYVVPGTAINRQRRGPYAP